MSGGPLSGVRPSLAESPSFPLPQANPGVMNGEPLQAKVTVTNPMGLHLRPAAAVARRAAQYPGAVTVSKDGRAVNAKSALDLVLLVAEQGAELVVEVAGAGPEAEATLAAVAEILAAAAMDDDTPPPKG